MNKRWSEKYEVVQPSLATHVVWDDSMDPKPLPCPYPRSMHVRFLRLKTDTDSKLRRAAIDLIEKQIIVYETKLSTLRQELADLKDPWI